MPAKTPETDKLIAQLTDGAGARTCKIEACIRLCRKLERERNKARRDAADAVAAYDALCAAYDTERRRAAGRRSSYSSM